MTAFPDLVPELRERLLLEPDAFEAELLAFAGGFGVRPFGPEQLEHALGYPWARPEGSFLLDGEEVGPPDPGAIAGRHPILAFGSNCAPSTLARKFAHFEDPADRRILVLAGDLHDFDVGPAATIAYYGAMPATLFASPGTAVRAAVLFTTDAQATQLTWSEITYRFGRLDGVRFDADAEIDVSVECVLAYASRFGHYCPGGERLAMAAIPARDRAARACTQRELLGLAAAAAGHTDAEALLEQLFADFGSVPGIIRDHLHPQARPFTSDLWTPFA